MGMIIFRKPSVNMKAMHWAQSNVVRRIGYCDHLIVQSLLLNNGDNEFCSYLEERLIPKPPPPYRENENGKET
jgi:hypothetical protein